MIKEEQIKYRLQRAEESYQAAQLMADNKYWNFCINRLYYTCFYAAIALLLKHNITPKTHEGAKRQFGLHFVKTGKINETHNALYLQLFG
ncbi:HEPN domain-containing protein [Tunicatimonas pelagia]|uniref:HEPN domain-containing protein n=1 Tax=Tunicatimonas pelagia TaxID=931531 RepID=UPI00266590CB|nr:HEPN domain-containing protein [Tunicatimonas pelagia]WKN46120.1 HEPN domain-containing protein [Tunicatimonas pelagia]